MKLKVISSKNILADLENIKNVSAPTTDGRIQILPGHVNLVSTLDMGELRYESDMGKELLYINGGFIVVKQDEILILADDADHPDELIKQQLDEAIKNAQKEIENISSPAELIQLEKQLKYEKFKRDRAA